MPRKRRRTGESRGAQPERREQKPLGQRIQTASQAAFHQLAEENEAQVRVERPRPWLVGQGLCRGQGDDAFPSVCRSHTLVDDLLKEGAMGGKAGGMGQRTSQGCLGPGRQGRQVLAERIVQGPDPAAHPAHDQQAGHHGLGQRGQIVDHVGRDPVDIWDDLSMAKRIKKPHLPALGKAQHQTRSHAVVDGTLGQGADKGEIGSHVCEAII